MDTVLDFAPGATIEPGSAEIRTVDRFLAWEDNQEGRHEFDGRRVIAMTGGSIAHQRIVLNTCVALAALLGDKPLMALHEMRIQAGGSVRYPDVVVYATPLDQTTRTLTDAVALFEVLSDDTATTDRVEKLLDYGALASLRCYVLLEQNTIGATVFQRDPGGVWIANAHTGGTLTLTALGVALPLADLYRGLTFTA